jgi:hypothetical protein
MTFVLNLYKQNVNRSFKRLIMSSQTEQQPAQQPEEQPEEQPEQQPEEPIQMGDNIKDLNFLLGINPNYLD